MNGPGPGTRRNRSPLRERGDEVRALQVAAEEAAAATGRFVAILGPPGVGKTRLLGVAESVARAGGFRVLHASGRELERELAFGGARQLLERRSDRPTLFAAVDRAQTAASERPDSAHDRQTALIDGLHRYTVGLAETRPTALLVDDAHWLDDASLRFLAFLARRMDASRLLLVVAARSVEPGAAEQLATLLGVPTAASLSPRLLSAGATASLLAELLGADPAPGFTDACVVATGGNPLLVGELVRGLRTAGVQGRHEEISLVESMGLEPVAQAVRATLAALPPTARAIVLALALLGGHGDRKLLGRLAGVEPEETDKLLEALTRAGVGADDGTLRLAHPLQAQSVLGAISPAERAELHHRAAELLAEAGDELAAAAHLRHSAPVGEAWAVDALRAAAQQAQLFGDPSGAVRLLTRALAEPMPELRAILLADLGRAQRAAGDDRAPATIEEAIGATADAGVQAELLLTLSWAHQSRGRYAEAVRSAARGLALNAGSGAVRAQLDAMRDAAVAWSSLDPPGRTAGPISSAVPRTHADRVELATEARRRMLAGVDHAAAAELARAAWGDGDFLRSSTADDPALPRILTVFHNADLQSEALVVAEACREDAELRGLPMARATWEHLRGHVLQYAGRLEEAEAGLREGFAARAYGWGAYAPVNLAALVFVLLERDDLAGAEAMLAEAELTPLHSLSSPMWVITDAARGRLALHRGEPERALQILERARRQARDQLGTSNPALMPWRADAAIALHELGRGSGALELALEDLSEARAWGAPRALGMALRVLGTVGPEAERLTRLKAAVDVLAPSETRLDYAYALHALGRVQSEADPREARLTLRAALDLASACGAARLTRRCHQDLVAAGGRPRRPRATGTESLTAAEREVAELASEGLGNREIAQRLSISSRTVAFHLTNVYRKLGVAGRAELTRP